MKHSLISALITLATVSLHATAAVVDYVSGTPISSSGYYQYHTKWVTTTCYETITKGNDCSYYGGDFVGDYETVSPQVHPGPDYKDYNTVYETVYETAYPYPYPYPYEAASSYPYETAQPYPSNMVCYPETVYSTVYPESSDKMYHTFTASGMDATVTGSPVYHTMDSTILETVTATPSGESECSTGPFIVNPGFDDLRNWPGAWFPSGQVSLISNSPGTSDGSTAFVRLPDGGQLEQAIIIPNNRAYALRFWYRMSPSHVSPDATYTMVISLGSYASQSIDSTAGDWHEVTLLLGRPSGPSDCLPVVFSFKVTYNGESDEFQTFDLDRLQLLMAGVGV